MINYNNKFFKTQSNSPNGDTNEETIFHYKQNGNYITATYKGGTIKTGFLSGTVNKDGSINMQYHHTNIKNELLTGVCFSEPEIMPDGKIKIIENWQWTCKNFSKGRSILIETDLEI